MSSAASIPDWELVTREAAWQARDSQGEMVHDGHLWILGGWFDRHLPNPCDVWKSPDGKNWTRTTECAPWVQSDLPASMSFKGRLWMMGGRKLPGTEVSNKVWSSVDGAKWDLVTESAGWCPRLSPGFAVFKDRMWVFGGTSDFYLNDDKTMFNDVWSTADGKDWRLETANAGWSKRAHGQGVVFQKKLWKIGGGSWKPEMIPTNDVWCSEDGKKWTCVTPAAQWKPRIWFNCVPYRNRLWIFAGWSAEHGNFGDTWYSKDGKDWTEFKSKTCWTKRHEPSGFLFNDRIWLAGGHAEPLNSEVWSLYIPPDYFKD